MIRFAADEDLDNHIVRGLRSRLGSIDVVRVQDAAVGGAPDQEVPAWAAQADRVLLQEPTPLPSPRKRGGRRRLPRRRMRRCPRRLRSRRRPPRRPSRRALRRSSAASAEVLSRRAPFETRRTQPGPRPLSSGSHAAAPLRPRPPRRPEATARRRGRRLRFAPARWPASLVSSGSPGSSARAAPWSMSCLRPASSRCGLRRRPRTRDGQGKVIDRGRASTRGGLLVLEGDEALLTAPVAVRVDEGALESVAFPDHSNDVDRNMS